MPPISRSVQLQGDGPLAPAPTVPLARAEVTDPVRWRFLVLYTLAFASTSLVLIAPLLVTLALKVQGLVGTKQAPGNLALVVSIGALVAMVGNPFFGRMSDRTSSRFGMRRPWMVVGLLGGSIGILVVAVAPTIPLVLLGWCIAQLGFNALLAAEVAVLPDQVPTSQRGMVSGVLGVCTPVASVSGTFLVQLFAPDRLAMFLAPCAIGGVFVLLFAVTLKDRRLAGADRPAWSFREFATTFTFNPRKAPDFAWAFGSRFLFVLAYAFLATYETYYLIDRLDSAQADVPRQVFLATLVQSSAVIAASLVGGRISDRTGRRKIFVVAASAMYGIAMFVIAFAGDFTAFLVGVAIGGLAFGAYFAVDLALVADVLPDRRNAAKDLGVLNIAAALPFSLAPAIAPAVLAIGGGDYAALYSVAGVVAILGAFAILPVRRVR
jgi:MFS family permease